jgi:hypothetical protein
MSVVAAKSVDSDMESLKTKYPAIYAVWNARPEGLIIKDVNLLECTQTLWKRYDACLKQAILSNVAWIECRGGDIIIADLSSGVMKNKEGDVCGYDFLMSSPLVRPSMYSDGVFPFRYAHVVPALMISNFMKATQSDNIDMTVMCQGYGYTAEEEWWGREDSSAEKAVECVVESDVFKEFVANSTPKPIKRICIWLLCFGHAFSVVWEQSKSRNASTDVIYFIDNYVMENAAVDAFRRDFLNRFRDRIANHRNLDALIVRNMFDRSLFSDDDILIQSDLVCVSFMARSTAYLNTMDLFIDKKAVKFIVNLADPRFQAFCYYEFEKALSNFLEFGLLSKTKKRASRSQSKKCVWLPSVMRNKFVNINDIHLLTLDPTTGDTANATQFEFFFDAKSEFKAVGGELVAMNIGGEPKTGGVCTIATSFTPDPTELSLRAAAAGLRECRGVLGEALASILRK